MQGWRRAPATGARSRQWQQLARTTSRLRGDLPFILIDAALVTATYLMLLVLRFDARVPREWWGRFRIFLVVALAIHLAANRLTGLYGSLWRHAGVHEAQRLVEAGAIALVLVPLASIPTADHLPLTVTIVGPLIATGLIGVSRFQTRLFALKRSRTANGSSSEGLRVAVLGAGNAGAAIVRDMLANPQLGMVPVALLDDDRRKQDRTLLGVPVVGGLDELPVQAPARRFHQALLAIPSADQGVVQRAAAAAEAAGVPLRVVPGLDELVNGQVSLRDVRELRIDDLLGRVQVETDLAAVRSLLAGQVVMVTGGGGSIGREIARQVADAGPSRLILLDHDETHLHDAVVDLPTPAVSVLADIRDAVEVEALFDRFRPQVVFHAAAHKHVPLLESHPAEAFRTNVLGTANVIRASQRVGVERLVIISTDKAVRPTSVMGASKRLAERLLVTSTPAGRQWCAVRFGNVLGSRGSVVPTFVRQIAQGGPVTVTDPRMTRYFMSISEAVQLVLQAAALSRGGELFMLEMGEPVRIMDLARRMIRLSGRQEGTDVEIRVVGVRPGEKLVEELRTPAESMASTAHPAVVRLQPLPENGEELFHELHILQKLADNNESDELARCLLTFARDEPECSKDVEPEVQVAAVASNGNGASPAFPPPQSVGGAPAFVPASLARSNGRRASE